MLLVPKSHGKTQKNSGVRHWWHQRLTAMLMVPLVISSLYLVIKIGNSDYEQAIALLQNPLHGAILFLLIIIGLWHSMLGVQVIIEDYISTETTRVIAILFVNSALILLATLSALSFLIILTA